MNREAFIQTWIPLTDNFFRLAVHLLGDEAAARDAVQDLLAKLWVRRERLDGIADPEAYGITLLRNGCLDRLRHDKAHPSKPLEPADIPGTGPPPEEELIREETLRRTLRAVEKLPEPQRTALRKRIWEEKSYEEIAAETGRRPLHRRVLVSLARKNLKKNLL